MILDLASLDRVWGVLVNDLGKFLGEVSVVSTL